MSWWNHEREDIDLSPPYQRNGKAWTKQQKQYLIDSILNDYDVPKLYIADFTFIDGEMNLSKRRYAVIDGKQRLSAIFDFFDGEIKLAPDFVYSEDPSLKLAGLSYIDLLKTFPKIARKFDNANFTVMRVITDDEAKINDLFVRLNSSKPLNGAEIRNAMAGRLPTIVREIVDHKFFKACINFNTNRSQDKNLAAKLLLLEHRGAIVDTKKIQLDGLAREAIDVEDLENDQINDTIIETSSFMENSNIQVSAARVVKNLDRLSLVFGSCDDLLRQPTQIVVVYWFSRSLDDERIKFLAEFLKYFEDLRHQNKDMNADDELSHYEFLMRNGNDSSSIRGRCEIMASRFERWELNSLF